MCHARSSHVKTYFTSEEHVIVGVVFPDLNHMKGLERATAFLTGHDDWDLCELCVAATKELGLLDG